MCCTTSAASPTFPSPFKEKVEEHWEMNTYVTCECLGWRGAWNSEERRRAENDLGATLYFGLPYYARWATVAAKTLINKGLITPDELIGQDGRGAGPDMEEAHERAQVRTSETASPSSDATTLFHTRTQAFTRGRTGVVVEHRPEWVIPEDEAWGREDVERGGR